MILRTATHDVPKSSLTPFSLTRSSTVNCSVLRAGAEKNEFRCKVSPGMIVSNTGKLFCKVRNMLDRRY